MSLKIKKTLIFIKNIGITFIVLPWIPIFIKFWNQVGKYVGQFIRNVYFFVEI